MTRQRTEPAVARLAIGRPGLGREDFASELGETGPVFVGDGFGMDIGCEVPLRGRERKCVGWDMDGRDFAQQMQRLSDEELTEIVSFGERDGYLPEAVEAARKELVARKLTSTDVSTIAHSVVTRRNRETELASQPLSWSAKTVRIRRLWAAYLAVYVVFFVVGVYSYLTDPRLTMDGPPLIQMAVDLLVMYGLFGFVMRRPIRHVALRVAFIIVAAFLCVRVAVGAYVLGPLSITFLLGAPLQLPAAFALWVYPTKLSHTPSATLVAQEFD